MREQIDPRTVLAGLNNRVDFPQAHIEQLAEAYKQPDHTIPDPIYRRLPDGSLQIVAGECRTRAARLAGLDLIWADVRDNMSDADALKVMFRENESRKDTNVIEKAQFYKRYATEILKQSPDELNAAEIARAVGDNPDLVRRRLSLLALNEQYRDLLIKGVITITAAESLAKLDVNRQRLCYQRWLGLKDEDRSGERLAVLAKHYRTMQDEEAAKEAQGSLFDDPLFTGQPIACSWDDLRAKMAIVQPVKVDTSVLQAERDALAKELADLKALVIANVTKERKEAARVRAENKALKLQLAKMWNLKAQPNNSNVKLVQANVR